MNENQNIEGWRWLPRICMSIFTANTFFYTSIIDRISRVTNFTGEERNELGYLLPWMELIYKVLHKSIWRSDDFKEHLYFETEPNYVYRATLLTDS